MMVSNLQLQEKYNKIRKNFCFYLDIQEPSLSRSISRRLQDMGLREESFLTSRVTHVVGARSETVARCARREGRARADAMLQRLRQPPPPQHHNYVHLTVQKAISLLDKLYDTFFTAPRKAHVNLFSKHFIKIEFLDKLCRPVYKEFDEWPQISLEPDPPKEKKDKKDTPENLVNANPSNNHIQKMTRKSRPRIKEREEKEQKGGYCEMCNADYVDAAIHRRSPHHLAFVRDHTNFLALDSLITSGTDVSTFLDKTMPVNGERRSLRKLCNGDVEPKSKRSKRSQSPDNINGNVSPRRNGGLDDEKKHNTRCSKRTSESQPSEDRQYYKVVGVSTKLRSSGSFAVKKKDSPTCNGTKPLVVKFRKVRRSELSVLSDEAEQFMFPKRASSTSSTSSDEDDKGETLKTRRKTPPKPPPPIERQRLARPVALKEESSEEDSWPEDKRRRKRRVPAVAKRGKRVAGRPPVVECQKKSPEPVEPEKPVEQPQPEPEVSPLREEPSERCMKWEDGKLKYTPAVEQLEFAFESVPRSEPWFETFKRQDQDKLVARNVPQYFELYSKSPKLPYEIGQLPPLKPNCCPLSDLVKREEKPGPSRSYGTRGMKKQRIKKRTAALLALEGHPRKSPREHASTLAILGSAGLLQTRKHAEDTKSTASEDTVSDTQSNVKVESVLSETQEASERLQQFLSEVFEEPTDYEISYDLGDETAVIASKNLPDVSSLVSECDDCDIIRNEIKQGATGCMRGRRGKFKKKNRTGWPNKKKQTKKDSRTSSMELEQKADSSLDRSSAELPEDETTRDTLSEENNTLSETDERTLTNEKLNSFEAHKSETPKKDINNITLELKEKATPMVVNHNDKMQKEDRSLHLDLKVVLHDKINHKTPTKGDNEKDEKGANRSSASDAEDKDEKAKKKKRVLQGLLLQPIVRVARVDPNVGRRLRSAGRARTNRFR
ncbi:neurofilament heavy polypeptide isoform X1 [Nymphalis io]|uniref:neurofilament heavy polypeptide isoform X1 n=2 Tax=Inachis io TaxID=171585 RepID=UPI00216A7D37|nr:neurofilament heavy polypeptide isoform X1 [Nymphalis io]